MPNRIASFHNFHLIRSRRVATFIAAALLTITSPPNAHCAPSTPLPGRALSQAEAASISAVFSMLTKHKLTDWFTLGAKINAAGRIRASLPDDPYMAAEEKAGDTPYAYTLPDIFAPKTPIVILLAPRFFTATPTSKVEMIVHEEGHWKAFINVGHSDEFDGYKAEYDVATLLGFTESDGLPYWAMMDGVAQYVVPRDASYAHKPDIRDYMKPDPADKTTSKQ